MRSKDFARKDGLSVDRYYKEALSRAGEVRADRKTIPILGSIILPSNRKRLFDVMEYGLRGDKPVPRSFIWLAPQIPNWGATTLLSETIRGIQGKILPNLKDDDNEPIKSVSFTSGRSPRYLEKSFDHVCESSVARFPGALEILLIPRILVAAIVHSPVGSPSGHPVPLGLVSFDEAVLVRAQEYLRSNMPPYVTDERLFAEIDESLSM